MWTGVDCSSVERIYIRLKCAGVLGVGLHVLQLLPLAVAPLLPLYVLQKLSTICILSSLEDNPLGSSFKSVRKLAIGDTVIYRNPVMTVLF